jgi:hypothetical protein
MVVTLPEGAANVGMTDDPAVLLLGFCGERLPIQLDGLIELLLQALEHSAIEIIHQDLDQAMLKPFGGCHA